MSFLFTFLIHCRYKSAVKYVLGECLLQAASAIPPWGFLYIRDQLNSITAEDDACDFTSQVASSILLTKVREGEVSVHGHLGLLRTVE